MKGKKKKQIITVLCVLVACLLLSSVGLLMLCKTGVLYSAMINHLAEAQVTPNSEKLCHAILNNDSFTLFEKVKLLKFNQYFVDNKYIECDRVCEKIATITITKNDRSLLGEGISAEYKAENSITFADFKNRWYSLPHELHHSMENENLSHAECGWFKEGFTCLVSYEYFDFEDDGINMLTFFVRGLCEIVGSDVLFETDACGDINVLKKALVGKGIGEDTIDKAFEVFYDLWMSDSYGSVATDKQKVEAIKVLVEMYDIANGFPEDVPESLCIAGQIMMGLGQNSDY